MSKKTPKPTYIEYIEFSSYAEFKRFRNMPAITKEETFAVDVDLLTKRLQEN